VRCNANEFARSIGPLTSGASAARRVGNASLDGLLAGFDPTDVGSGLTVAP
jgi:hypothetical protein